MPAAAPAAVADAAAAAPSFTLAAFNGSVPRALGQLMLLLQHMSASDQLAERLDATMELPATSG
jgi:hypothetical protein